MVVVTEINCKGWWYAINVAYLKKNPQYYIDGTKLLKICLVQVALCKFVITSCPDKAFSLAHAGEANPTYGEHAWSWGVCAVPSPSRGLWVDLCYKRRSSLLKIISAASVKSTDTLVSAIAFFLGTEVITLVVGQRQLRKHSCAVS